MHPPKRIFPDDQSTFLIDKSSGRWSQMYEFDSSLPGWKSNRRIFPTFWRLCLAQTGEHRICTVQAEQV